MTSQTFEGIDGTRLLHIKNLGKHVTMSIEVPGQVHMGITFDPASIPALALAELEAAGHKEEQGNETTEAAHHFGMSMLHLRLGIKEQDYITAEAKAQAELEAEALELLNVVREARGIKPHLTAGEASPEAMNEWLAVARKAREMRAEK